MTATDDMIEALYVALERWDAAERTARDLRRITKADVRRRTRLPNGDRILTPRRSALARYLADAALTVQRNEPAAVEERDKLRMVIVNAIDNIAHGRYGHAIRQLRAARSLFDA